MPHGCGGPISVVCINNGVKNVLISVFPCPCIPDLSQLFISLPLQPPACFYYYCYFFFGRVGRSVCGFSLLFLALSRLNDASFCHCCHCVNILFSIPFFFYYKNCCCSLSPRSHLPFAYFHLFSFELCALFYFLSIFFEQTFLKGGPFVLINIFN